MTDMVRIEKGIKKQLERLKKGEFKRKYKTKSISNVIAKLLDIKNKYEILKEQQKAIVKTGTTAEPQTLEQNPNEEQTESQEEPQIAEDIPFPCYKLCRKFRSCTLNAQGELGEILAIHCYESKYPYQYRTLKNYIRTCPFAYFPNNTPHNAEYPYPQCQARQKDVPFELPKDRLIRNPQLCWECYNDYRHRKRIQKARERRQQEPREYRGKPQVNWGDSEGSPDLWRLENT